MKKRKIFVGVLLAAATISLAACTKSPKKTETTSTDPVTTDTTPVTTGTTPITTGTDPVTTGTTPVTTDTTPVTTPAVDQITVTFHRILETGKTEVLKIVSIDKGTAATPLSDADCAVQGYKFLGWYTTKNATKQYDFTKLLEADTNIYGKYEKNDEVYEGIKASENNILAYDFDDTTASTTLDDYMLEDISVGTGSYAFAQGKLGINCVNDSNYGKVALNMASPIKNGVIRGCFKASTTTVSSVNYITFIGKKSDSGNESYNIGATTNGLRYNGAEDKTTVIAADTEYRYYFVLDLVNNKFTLTVDGNATAVTDIAINFTEFNGIEFGGKKSSALSVTIDNLALEAELASADEVKAASKVELKALYDAYAETDNIDDTEFEAITTAYNNGISSIDAATTVDAANEALEAAKTAVTGAVTTYRSTKKAAYLDMISDFELDQTKYNALSPEDKAAADEAYANVVSTYSALMNKTTTVVEMKNVFDKAQEKCDYILADKYDITVNFYTKTVTKNEETGEDVVTITKIGDAIYKIAQGKKAVSEDVPGLANYFTLGVFNSDALTTAFDFNTTITDNSTVIYVEVSKTLAMKYTEYDAESNLDGQTSKYGFTIKTSNGAGIVIGNNAVKYASNGSNADQYVAVTLAAGTYEIAINGKSGSSGAQAFLNVEAGDNVTKLTFENSAASVEKVNVTLTEETTVYFYRVDGKTVNVYDIAITNKAE